jgi:hypothetical protein
MDRRALATPEEFQALLLLPQEARFEMGTQKGGLELSTPDLQKGRVLTTNKKQREHEYQAQSYQRPPHESPSTHAS